MNSRYLATFHSADAFHAAIAAAVMAGLLFHAVAGDDFWRIEYTGGY